MPIVTIRGFHTESSRNFIEADRIGEVQPRPRSVAICNDADPRVLAPFFGIIDLIAIDFPDFADGRGFSLARRLRTLGYKGHLRAKGSVISDQFGQALSCGFDEVEIDEALAKRQPEDHWRAAAFRHLRRL